MRLVEDDQVHAHADHEHICAMSQLFVPHQHDYVGWSGRALKSPEQRARVRALRIDAYADDGQLVWRLQPCGWRTARLTRALGSLER